MAALDGIDLESLRLIVQLQQEDADGLVNGKGRGFEAAPDNEFAAELFKSELKALETVASDRTMCLSMARAVDADQQAIDRHTQIEEEATRDRQEALRHTAPQPARPTASRPAGQRTDQDQETTRKGTDANPDAARSKQLPVLSSIRALKALSLSNDNKKEKSVSAGRSSTVKGPSVSLKNNEKEKTLSRSRKPDITCIACSDNVMVWDAVHCPCSHDYCHNCVKDLYKASMTDESLFPPRCCKLPIPVSLAEQALSRDLISQFETKALEFGIPNRTYCHQLTCSTFIPPSTIHNSIAACPKCNKKTCTICKGSTHDGDCPQDETTQEILRIAKENGWQRCKSCRRVVELNHGCNHISESSCTGIIRPSPLEESTLTNISKPVFAATSSATLVGSNGRRADARNGTRIAC